MKKDIPGFEGLYAATKSGKIWSYKYRLWMKPYLTHRGYHRLSLFKDCKYTKKHVHQLVMMTYVGPQGDMDVNHKSSNKLNNRLSNLEYVTRKENIHHAIKAGTNKIRGIDGAKTKLTIKQVRKIKYEETDGNYILAKKYGVSATAIYLIRKGKNWCYV